MKNHTRLTFHKEALKHSLVFLSRKRVATLVTVVVLAMALLLCALFWVFSDNMSHLTAHWQRSGHMSLYLEKSTSESEAANLLARIRSTPGVEEAELKTPEQGLAMLQRQDGMQDIMRYLPENPLPAVIDVIPSPTISSVSAVDALLQTLKAYPHIEEARLDMAWMSRLFALLNFLGEFARMIMALLSMAVVLIIGNTLRLIIQERQEEIEILRLMGAGDAYIIRPFLYSGLCYGLSAAVIAVIGVNVFIYSLGRHIQALFSAYQMNVTLSFMSFYQTMVLILLAMSFGWIAARLSVRLALAKSTPFHSR